MADWPSGLPIPNIDYTHSFLRTAIRSEFDAGYELTRPKWTRTRREFKNTFKPLTKANIDTLVDFFEGIGYGGGSFFWLCPETTEVYEVRIAEDRLDFVYIADEKYELTLTFREV